MTKNGWQAIGDVARERRERLGLNQDDLWRYGGPRVATVGKFERAAQSNFPLRTQHQIENALGWSRGTIEQFVAAWDEGDAADMDAWAYDLTHEHVPDLSRPLSGAGAGMLPSGLRPPPLQDLDGASLSTLYASVVTFFETVRQLDPALSNRAVEAMFTVARLYSDAIWVLEGGEERAPSAAPQLEAVADHDPVDPLDEAEQTERET